MNNVQKLNLLGLIFKVVYKITKNWNIFHFQESFQCALPCVIQFCPSSMKLFYEGSKNFGVFENLDCFDDNVVPNKFDD